MLQKENMFLKAQASRVDAVLVSALPEEAHVHFRRQTTSDTIYQTSKVNMMARTMSVECFCLSESVVDSLNFAE